MQNKPFLSIVIPVYNGELVINRCLNSIWEQGLERSTYEVICVNDCSSDNTEYVIKQAQKTHKNLRLLSNPVNKRAGGSRNYGVKEAKGKYIVFIDADDYFHQSVLKKVIEYLSKNELDILVCDFARHTIAAPNNKLVHNFQSTKIMSGRDFMITNSLPYAPWKYIFKKDLMLSNNCFFEECVSCEDVDWTHKIAFFAGKMQYLPILLTHYILEPNSQTGAEYKNSSSVFNRIYSGYRLMQLITYCNTKDEESYLKKVAVSTYENGLLFFNGLSISPKKKSAIISKYVITDQVSGLLGFATKYPMIYSTISTIISPFFRIIITIKRSLLGR